MQWLDLEQTTAEELTRQSMTALRAGDKLQAYELLTEALRIDENSAEAWLWIAGVVATDAERHYCLERSLQLAPSNPTAHHGLSLLPDVPAKAPAFARTEQPEPQPSQPEASAAAAETPQPEASAAAAETPHQPVIWTSQAAFAPADRVARPISLKPAVSMAAPLAMEAAGPDSPIAPRMVALLAVLVVLLVVGAAVAGLVLV